MFKRYKKIYYIKNISEIGPYLNKDSYNYVKYVCSFLYIINEYDKLNEYIINHLQNATDKTLDLLNYYRCLLYYEKKEIYNFEKLYISLSENSQKKVDIVKCKGNNELITFFDNEIAHNLKSKKLKKKYGALVYELYLLNLVRKEKYIFNIKFNIEICNVISKILKKKDIGVNNLNFLISIIGITNSFYSYNFDVEREFPISLELLEKIVYTIRDNMKLYGPLYKNDVVENNEFVCLGFRMLLSITNDEKKQDNYINELNNFINSNKVSEYTKFINEITSISSERKRDINVYLEMIRKIFSGEIDGDIMHTIYMCCAFLGNQRDLIEFKNRFIEINPPSNKKDIYNLGKNILLFWCGEKASLQFLNKNIYINEFLTSLIKFSNGDINYLTFLDNIGKIKRIDAFSIFNWDVLGNLFYKNDFRWLTLILEKIPVSEYNAKLFNYLMELYVSLLNGKRHIFLKDFMKIDKVFSKKNINSTVNMYAIMCYIGVYNLFDEYVMNKILIVLNDNEKLKAHDDVIVSFFTLVIIFNLRCNSCIDINLISSNINKYDLDDKNNNLLYMGLAYLGYSFSQEKQYIELAKLLFDFYKNNNLHDGYDFSLISSIANIILEKNVHVFNIDIDEIYSDNKKFYALSSNLSSELEPVYRELEIEIIDKVNEKMHVDSLMSLLICRTYFMNVEKFGVGKAINLPKHLSGKELINALLDELGYNENIQNITEIKNGKNIKTLWLNEYNLHQFMKDIKSQNDNKFINSYNNLVLKNKKIIHVTSLALLVKLGVVKKLVECRDYFCTGHTFKEFLKMDSQGTLDIIDGIIEEAVCYDDYLNDILSCLNEMNNNDCIEYVSSANVLGMNDINYINSFDAEIFKIVISNDSDNNFSLVTEDPFYFKSDLFCRISHGTYTLLIDMHVRNIISSEELYNLTLKLGEMNYNLYVRKDAYLYLVNKADDIYISKIVDLLNKYIKFN